MSTVGITFSGNIKVIAGQAKDELYIRVCNKVVDNESETQHYIQSRPAGTNGVSYFSSKGIGTQVSNAIFMNHLKPNSFSYTWSLLFLVGPLCG